MFRRNRRRIRAESERLHAAFEGYHADGCLGCLDAFVAHRTADAVERLLFVLYCEQSENNGDGAVGVELGYALCDALAYICLLYTSDAADE